MQYYTLTNKSYLFTSKGTILIDNIDTLEEIPKNEFTDWSHHELAKAFPEAKGTIKRLIKEQRSKIEDLVRIENNIKNVCYRDCPNILRDWIEWFYTFIHVEIPRFNIELHLKRLERTLMYITNGKILKNGKFDIDKVRQRPISDFIEFDRSGFANSIFNTNDKTPSMKYYKKDNRVHCFSTGEDEDVIGVVMKLNNCDFISAVKIILN